MHALGRRGGSYLILLCLHCCRGLFFSHGRFLLAQLSCLLSRGSSLRLGIGSGPGISLRALRAFPEGPSGLSYDCRLIWGLLSADSSDRQVTVLSFGANQKPGKFWGSRSTRVGKGLNTVREVSVRKKKVPLGGRLHVPYILLSLEPWIRDLLPYLSQTGTVSCARFPGEANFFGSLHETPNFLTRRLICPKAAWEIRTIGRTERDHRCG